MIAAYARLERVLAAHRLPRRPAEAPLEYLARMLDDLAVSPEAARRLTDLFERAKFSQHAVGREMKEEAIAALETVRDDLLVARALAEEEHLAAMAAQRERTALDARGASCSPGFPLFLTLVLAVVLLVDPGRAELVVHVYALVLAAIGLGHLLAALRDALPPRVPSAFDAALRTRARPAQRIPELERMEREVALGLATAFDLHFRLRPTPPGDRNRAPGGAPRNRSRRQARTPRTACSATMPGRSSAAIASRRASTSPPASTSRSLRRAVAALEAL